MNYSIPLYITIPYCKGHITKEHDICKNCIADYKKEEAIRNGRMIEDNIRNTSCPFYKEMRLGVINLRVLGKFD